MNPVSIQQQLALVEQHLESAMRNLNDGRAQALVEASEGLQATAVGLVQLVNASRRSPDLTVHKEKIGLLAQKFIFLRENLIRRSAFVERALKVVMPTVEKSTYQSTGPYRSTTRSSGGINAYTA